MIELYIRDIKTKEAMRAPEATFETVCNMYKGQNAELVLVRFDYVSIEKGSLYKGECVIGNLQNKLTSQDYLKALYSLI